ncbi:MAG: recombinase family protein [Clostridia bacterium]|nr:recombinase family protein [Clostridia bacterium]
MAFGYIRVANEKTDGTIDQQKQLLIHFMESQGLPVYGFYVDFDYSFTNPMKRKGFLDMYQEIIKKPTDIIIVDTPVLTCKLYDYNTIVNVCNTLNINIYSAFQKVALTCDAVYVDLSTDIKAYIDELEREKKVRNMLSGRKKHFLN